MKRFLTGLLLFALCYSVSLAQSSTMTDDQIVQLILKEKEAGSSQAQIVTKLMQRGVKIQQIQRVRQKYEREIQQKGLGTVADEKMRQVTGRMRTNNGEEKKQKMDRSTQRRIRTGNTARRTYDEEDEDFMLMQQELEDFLPKDSIQWLEQLLEEQEQNRRKVFGRDIFNREDLTFEPAMNIATPQNYRLGPGDLVIVDVYGASQKTYEVNVSPDGEITIEGFGPIQVSGLTVEQANARLRSSLGARYSGSRVKLSVGQTRTITVNVMGEVSVPGTYTLSAFASVFHALYMAGGPNDLGTLRNIKVYRNNRLITTVDVYDYILNGQLTGNIRLADNDVISVEPYDCLVNITGKVKRPMFYEMKKDESLGTLLKYAGGFTGDAYKKAVRVVRKTGREFAVFNVEEFDMNVFHVADGDSVSVDSILQRYQNTVEVKGAVFRPGMYQMSKNIYSVRSLIEHAEGLTEEAFVNRAVMHRMKSDRTLEVISVNVAGIMDGSVADIPLKENDVLFIPTKQEAQIERTITIHGEVMFPGVYQYAENETLEDFVLQAGGLKETASTVKVDIARRVSNPKALSTDSVIARTYSVSLKDGFIVDGEPGFVLMPFDEVYVRKSPGYSEQQNVTIEGQIMFAGTYTLSNENERLSEIVKRAGGVTDQAYIAGARIERVYTQDELARRRTLMKLAYSQSGNDTIDVSKLDLGTTYAVGIELDKALANPGSDADIVIRQNDRIIIPEYNGTVKISGDVLFPNTIAYEKGKRLSYYINQAGGYGSRAKKSGTHIVYMNGTVAKGSKAKIMPGCEIVVPSKPKRNTNAAEILTIGTGVASIATMIATLANILK